MRAREIHFVALTLTLGIAGLSNGPLLAQSQLRPAIPATLVGHIGKPLSANIE